MSIQHINTISNRLSLRPPAARFAQSRFDAIRELRRIAEEEDCQFMVICRDASRGAFVQNVRNSPKKWTKL